MGGGAKEEEKKGGMKTDAPQARIIIRIIREGGEGKKLWWEERAPTVKGQNRRNRG